MRAMVLSSAGAGSLDLETRETPVALPGEVLVRVGACGVPYRHLWAERVVRSVANLTRDDARDFLALAGKAPLKSSVQIYDLAEANEALSALREGRVRGAAVLTIGSQSPAPSPEPPAP